MPAAPGVMSTCSGGRVSCGSRVITLSYSRAMALMNGPFSGAGSSRSAPAGLPAPSRVRESATIVPSGP